MKKIVVPTFYECLSLQVPFLFRLNIRHTRRISLFPGYLMHIWLTTINPIAPWAQCASPLTPPSSSWICSKRLGQKGLTVNWTNWLGLVLEYTEEQLSKPYHCILILPDSEAPRQIQFLSINGRENCSSVYSRTRITPNTCADFFLTWFIPQDDMKRKE